MALKKKNTPAKTTTPETPDATEPEAQAPEEDTQTAQDTENERMSEKEAELDAKLSEVSEQLKDIDNIKAELNKRLEALEKGSIEVEPVNENPDQVRTGPRAKLDRSRSYGEVYGQGVRHQYEQDGKLFDHNGIEI